VAPVGPPGTLAFPPLVGAKRTSEDGGRSAPRDRDDVIGLRRILRMQRTQTALFYPPRNARSAAASSAPSVAARQVCKSREKLFGVDPF
jgi:hypothetical protein